MDKNELVYKFGRNLSCGIFRLCLNPTIINELFIPENGPVILCGNHLHVWDQFPVMCATKRPIHWMAKQEYFDGKLSPIFKMMGCIPVDRKNNPHLAEEIALEYLKNNSIVGLFPEGTRNSYQVLKLEADKLKSKHQDLVDKINYDGCYSHKMIKECNDLEKQYYDVLNNLETEKNKIEAKGSKVIEGEELLPFKFGAVSMAQKTSSPIVPFGVTGDYSIGNKNLIVRFGEPIIVGDRNLEDANVELREKVQSLVKENRKL